jgi:4-diphosphocytidyl-2-C-methyl-D-erythritol kinase
MLKSGLNNIILPAPAKLNLMLHITGQRADGYHELQTVFQFIDFADELQFTLRDDQQISRHSDDFAVPVNDDIIIHATQVLRDRYQQGNSDESNSRKFGVDIRLKKNIPMGAGLGGGSSDAATTLLGLNLLWDMQFSIDELALMGLDLGADVPVFVRGFAAFAEGVGEQLSPLSLPEKWYLVVVPAVHVSTKEVFLNPDLTRDCSTIKLCDLSRREWRNVCTSVVCKNYPEVLQAIDIVGEYSKARMSGTGASVFAEFDSKEQAEEILQKILQNTATEGWNSFVAKGLNQSPLHYFLEKLE